MYKKCRKNLKGIAVRAPTDGEMIDIAGDLKSIADRHGLKVQSCAEKTDLSASGVKNGKCIGDELISDIVGQSITIGKDPGQRKRCLCSRRIDIGSYDTCTGGCLNCSANSDSVKAQKS